jgi:hypothetical protein
MAISNLNKGLLRLAIALSIIVGGLSAYRDEPSDIPEFDPYLDSQVLNELKKPVCKNGELSYFYDEKVSPIKYSYIVIIGFQYDENKKVIGFTPGKDECPALERLAQLIGHEKLKKKLEYKVADLTPEYIKKVVADSKTQLRWEYLKFKAHAIFSTIFSLWVALGFIYGFGFLVRWVYLGFKK